MIEPRSGKNECSNVEKRWDFSIGQDFLSKDSVLKLTSPHEWSCPPWFFLDWKILQYTMGEKRQKYVWFSKWHQNRQKITTKNLPPAEQGGWNFQVLRLLPTFRELRDIGKSIINTIIDISTNKFAVNISCEDLGLMTLYPQTWKYDHCKSLWNSLSLISQKHGARPTTLLLVKVFAKKIFQLGSFCSASSTPHRL